MFEDGPAFRLEARHACCLFGPTALQIRPGLGRVTVVLPSAPAGIGQWPAAWLSGLGTPWNTLQLGGTMRVAPPGVLIEPWNPLAGSNWIYDTTPRRATEDAGVVADPYTGLYIPLKIESAACTVKTGLPVAKTLDWVTVDFADTIAVPETAWADWDAVNQVFIEAGKMTTPTLETLSKCTVTYPADLYEVTKWHDGSQFSVADIIMGMIMTFDRNREEGKPRDIVFRRLYAKLHSHTTRREARSCESCHADSLALGFGKGKLRYAVSGTTGRWQFTPEKKASPHDGLPEDAWTGFLAERSGMVSTQAGARPFSVAEQQRVLTVGACLTCHQGDSAVMRDAVRDFPALLRRRSASCAVPVWNPP